jgi:enoyl-CoA hydratase
VSDGAGQQARAVVSDGAGQQARAVVSDGTVVVRRPSAHAATIVIDRPPVNAIDRVTQRLLTEAFAAAEADTDVRAIVLAATGRHFCAGADLREEQSLDRGEVGDLMGDIGALLLAVRQHRCPVIAAVNGSAHGGGLELALACDIRVVGPGASFAAAGVNVGLIASFASLHELIGAARARHLLLTGERCDATRALDWGLATAASDSTEALLADAEALAATIATKSPLSVEATKRCLNRVRDLASREAAALQVDTFAELFSTRDHAEALSAFFERRSPAFERR